MRSVLNWGGGSTGADGEVAAAAVGIGNGLSRDGDGELLKLALGAGGAAVGVGELAAGEGCGVLGSGGAACGEAGAKVGTAGTLGDELCCAGSDGGAPLLPGSAIPVSSSSAFAVAGSSTPVGGNLCRCW